MACVPTAKLPRFFAHVSGKRQSPERATLFIATLTVVVGLALLKRLGLLVSLVNFGALTGFLLVHLSVFVRFGLKPGRNWFLHVISPILGFAIIAYVLYNTDIWAKVLGLCWLLVGVAVLVTLKLLKKPVDVVGV